MKRAEINDLEWSGRNSGVRYQEVVALGDGIDGGARRFQVAPLKIAGVYPA